jgi:hypothetical protein
MADVDQPLAGAPYLVGLMNVRAPHIDALAASPCARNVNAQSMVDLTVGRSLQINPVEQVIKGMKLGTASRFWSRHFVHGARN